MRALYDLLMDRRRTLAIYNYDGTVDLQPVRSLLSAHGIQLAVEDADVQTPQGFAVLYDESGVLGTTTLAEVDRYANVETGVDERSSPHILSVVDPEATVVTEESVPKLVAISRELERLAWRDGYDEGGQMVVGFQTLSTFVEHKRTRDIYDTIARTGIDVTVCGFPDVTLDDPALSIYEDTDRRFVDYWFILYRGEERKGALVAREVEPDTFTGLWTRNGPLVDRLFETLAESYPELA